MRETRVITGVKADALPIEELIEEQQPAILKAAASDWPLVRKGLDSPAAAIAYLKMFDAGRPIVGYTGAPAINGRFFYNDDLTGLNFAAARVPLSQLLDRIGDHLDDAAAPSFYIGSTDLDQYLPGLRAEHSIDHPTFAQHPPTVSIWIGNRTVASCHFDFSNNIACNMVGRRRFTLFPPDQVANLYPGPLEPTPGGQVVSMVDFAAPDFDRHPNFRHALDSAQVAELEPGDLLIYPAMWWHHVEALDPFNAMINLWWNAVPAFIDSPMTTLLHGMLSLRDRPEGEKQAWRALFEHYVFGPPDQAARHLPEHIQGALAPMDDVRARRLRADLLRRMNR
jgi:hypothetical protein